MNIKNIYRKGAGSVCCGIAAALMALPMLTSCEDFFAQESDDVLYADTEHLTVAEDTIYSVTGILKKLQALADRTVLLGELRGDLVELTGEANKDLVQIYEFNVNDSNKYNNPSDYYAVINNCNYFIAHADTAYRDNRDDDIFMKEFCAVKTIRAWTYLQLVLNYGNVPFFTEPLLSKEEAEAAENGAKYNLMQVCNFFIEDLSSLQRRYNVETPNYGKVRDEESRLFFFPTSVVLGDLYLWRASLTGDQSDYLEAAWMYYMYIYDRSYRLGNGAYPLTLDARCYWEPGETSFLKFSGRDKIFPIEESTRYDAELITMIAGDKIPADGHYSELRNFFTSRDENNKKVSIVPSTRLEEISEAQTNVVLTKSGNETYFADHGLTEHMSGDLRLAAVWKKDVETDAITKDRIETQEISKWKKYPNVNIYRRTMLYLRMAEAFNGAGYPRMAFQILSEGLSDQAILDNVISRYQNYDAENDTVIYSETDSLLLSQFYFSDLYYQVAKAKDFVTLSSARVNQIGIHQRGSGFTPADTTYVLPNDTIETNPVKRAQLIEEQKVVVDSLILTESALEFAFEGTRYYDIMRYALRQSNPEATMNKIIGMRKGKAKATSTPLLNRQNWYLRWKGKIGYIGE